MATIKCFVYMFMCLAPVIHGYRKSDEAEVDQIFAVLDETFDIVCEIHVPISRCEITHPNGTKMLITDVPGGSCKITMNATMSEDGIWTCHSWGQTSRDIQDIHKKINVVVLMRTRHGDDNDKSDLTHFNVSETVTDDEPIVISTTTYVCSTIAFLVIFVALVYWKYRYYTLYYGKTWGDGDSIDSRVLKIYADPNIVQNGDHLLIT